MQIYVCIKHVPDSAATIAVLENNHIDENITFLLNPYDEHAVTEAVRIKGNNPGSEVIVVCLGKNNAEKTIRSAMAMGADRGILVVSDVCHEGIETAQALHNAIDQDGSPYIIFTGKESIDTEGMQTMFRLAALFDFPVATNVIKLAIEADMIRVGCELSGSVVESYEMSLPCVVAAGRGLNSPKYPTFPDVLQAKKKTLKKIPLAELNIKKSNVDMRLLKLTPMLQKREPKEISGSTEELAIEILRILKEEAKVL